jgi:hypothetical protein
MSECEKWTGQIFRLLKCFFGNAPSTPATFSTSLARNTIESAFHNCEYGLASTFTLSFTQTQQHPFTRWRLIQKETSQALVHLTQGIQSQPLILGYMYEKGLETRQVLRHLTQGMYGHDVILG